MDTTHRSTDFCRDVRLHQLNESDLKDPTTDATDNDPANEQGRRDGWVRHKRRGEAKGEAEELQRQAPHSSVFDRCDSDRSGIEGRPEHAGGTGDTAPYTNTGKGHATCHQVGRHEWTKGESIEVPVGVAKGLESIDDKRIGIYVCLCLCVRETQEDERRQVLKKRSITIFLRVRASVLFNLQQTVPDTSQRNRLTQVCAESIRKAQQQSRDAASP